MACKRTRLPDLFYCAVCHKDNDGDLPIVTPCGDRLCESCFEQQVREGRILTMTKRGLKCRKKSRGDTVNGENECLLEQVSQKEKNDATEEIHDKERVRYERCYEHGRELILFCFEDTCRKPICPSCLVDHTKHDVKGIETKEKEFLMKELETVKSDLEKKVEIVLNALKFVAYQNDKGKQKLRKAKADFGKSIDQQIESTERQYNEERKRLEEKLSGIRKEIEYMKNIEEDVKEDGADNEKIQNYREIIENLKPDESCLQFSYATNFVVFEIETDKCITKTPLHIFFPYWQNFEDECIKNEPPREFKTKTSQLQCTGTCAISPCTG